MSPIALNHGNDLIDEASHTVTGELKRSRLNRVAAPLLSQPRDREGSIRMSVLS